MSNKIYTLMEWLKREVDQADADAWETTDDTEVTEAEARKKALEDVITQVKNIYSGNF